MRAAPFLLLALALAGCLDWSNDPILKFPTSEVDAVSTSERYNVLTQELTVEVRGSVSMDNDATEAIVSAYLVAEPCGPGPRGVPQEHEAKEDETVAAPGGSFSMTLQATMAPGTRYAVIVASEPAGPSPGYARCVDGVAGTE